MDSLFHCDAAHLAKQSSKMEREGSRPALSLGMPGAHVTAVLPLPPSLPPAPLLLFPLFSSLPLRVLFSLLAGCRCHFFYIFTLSSFHQAATFSPSLLITFLSSCCPRPPPSLAHSGGAWLFFLPAPSSSLLPLPLLPGCCLSERCQFIPCLLGWGPGMVASSRAGSV